MVNTHVLPKLNYVFNVIPKRIPAGFYAYVFVEIDKHSKVYGSGKDLKYSTILKKLNEVGDSHLKL